MFNGKLSNTDHDCCMWSPLPETDLDLFNLEGSPPHVTTLYILFDQNSCQATSTAKKNQESFFFVDHVC